MATGTTFSTPETRSIDSASSIVSFCVVPPNTPGIPIVSVLPGLMARMLVPNWVNSEIM